MMKYLMVSSLQATDLMSHPNKELNPTITMAKLVATATIWLNFQSPIPSLTWLKTPNDLRERVTEWELMKKRKSDPRK
jgi:hypothetical protein